MAHSRPTVAATDDDDDDGDTADDGDDDGALILPPRSTEDRAVVMNLCYFFCTSCLVRFRGNELLLFGSERG